MKLLLCVAFVLIAEGLPTLDCVEKVAKLPWNDIRIDAPRPGPFRESSYATIKIVNGPFSLPPGFSISECSDDDDYAGAYGINHSLLEPGEHVVSIPFNHVYGFAVYNSANLVFNLSGNSHADQFTFESLGRSATHNLCGLGNYFVGCNFVVKVGEILQTVYLPTNIPTNLIATNYATNSRVYWYGSYEPKIGVWDGSNNTIIQATSDYCA